MINIVFVVLVALFFSGYAFFNAMAIVARTSASIVGKNAFGSSIEKIMNTLKRLMIFFYPPVLGYFVITEDLKSMLYSVLLSYLGAFFVQAAIIINRVALLNYFCIVAENFSDGRSIFLSFRGRDASIEHRWSDLKKIFPPISCVYGSPKSFQKFFQISLMASWVYFVFGASIFMLNIVATVYSNYAPIILQLLGLFNGLGTIVLAFFVDPIISRYLDAAEELNEITLSLLFSQMISYIVIPPIFYFFVFQALVFWDFL